jgi:mono/diheme cytochrome c family protein
MNSSSEQGSSDFNPVPLLILIAIFAVMLTLALAGTPQARQREIGFVPTVQPTRTPIPPTIAPTQVVEVAAVSYAPEQIETGRDTFLTTCAACHGQNAQGIQGLGKNLIESEFVSGMSDDELVQFIIVGRQPSDPANTTGLPMPARGGNPMLSDEVIYSIVAYLRSAAAPTDLGVVGGDVQPAPQVDTALVLQPFELPAVVSAASDYAARGDTAARAAYTAAESYGLSCAGCHGVDGRGVAGLAPSLLESDLWGDGAALYAFLTKAQPPSSPAIGFPHPTHGAYPLLSDAELLALIGYLYSLDG